MFIARQDKGGQKLGRGAEVANSVRYREKPAWAAARGWRRPASGLDRDGAEQEARGAGAANCRREGGIQKQASPGKMSAPDGEGVVEN